MTNIGGLTFKNIKLREEYEHNKKKCACCGSDISYEQRRNKFCSHSCSAAITNLGRKVSKEHKDKVRNSVLEWQRINPDKVEKSQHIELTCQQCSEKFFVPPSGKKRKFCSRKCADVGHDKSSSGGYREGSGRGKKGWYKGYWCDSSWELAWVIYSLEHDLKFKRNMTGFDYVFEGKQRKYYPDYLIDNSVYVEIKGYDQAQWQAKLKAFPHKIEVLGKREIAPILTYVIEKYGKDFVRMYEKKPESP
jgi:endogenous inhibitor of DNA gyrase (YacG/DUF329 family)